jgi:hypothetical protein
MSREEVKDACIRDEGMASLIQFRCRSILSRFQKVLSSGDTSRVTGARRGSEYYGERERESMIIIVLTQI